MSEQGRLSYREAGVDREAAARAKSGIGRLVQATHGAAVVSQPGSFGGLFRVPTDMRDPLLASSADGVGTKLKIAFLTGRHDTVGRDLVNHCVDDILVEGARPLFFLDYIGMGRLAEGTVEALVEGMAAACSDNGCALLGGETAEMPDFYAPGEYDLAGFIVGVVEEAKRPGAHRVRQGDRLVGVASDGFHTNGYSLLRRVLFDRLGLGVDDAFPGLDSSVGDVLLRVHRSYLKAVGPLLEDSRVRALAHITGGGIPENLPRVLPPGCGARIHRASWDVPHAFLSVQEHGRVDDEEMFRTFNMGVGMILIVASDAEPDVLGQLTASGETAWALGEITEGDGEVAFV